MCSSCGGNCNGKCASSSGAHGRWTRESSFEHEAARTPPTPKTLRMRKPGPGAPEPLRARILWPALGFPAFIAPRDRPGQSPFADGDATRRTHLANERTYLAWWRTGLACMAGSLGVGRVVPALTTGSEALAAIAGVLFGVLGVACFLYSEPKPDTVPFYQFMDPRNGRHFYTTHKYAEFAK